MTVASRLFSAAGFEQVVETDLGVTAFCHALADFEMLARDSEIGVVYYFGPPSSRHVSSFC